METIKCPRCASMNTEEIHYDANTEEGMTDYSVTSGRIGRDVASEQGWGARYRCHDCRRDFGSTSLRKGIMSDAMTYRQATRNILFEVGGLMQGFFTLRLERAEGGSFMQVSPGFIPDKESGKVQPGRVSITAEQWDTVVAQLYEELFVLDWKETYENPFVMDGQQWRLTLTMENGEELRYHGMNAYPVYWDRVLELFDPMSIIRAGEGGDGKADVADWVMANRSDKGRWSMVKETHRFEKPERLAELDPTGTLKRFGLKEGQTVCDIGAGTGIFTFPAAELTRNKVYALDIDDGMLDIIKGKIKKERTRNVIPMKGDGETLDFEDRSVDLVLMVTVFHHISDKPGLLREIRRVLTEEGRFALIEFHNRVTPSGPPVGNRIGKEEVLGFLEAAGFEEVDGFDLGENFYAKVFRAGASASQKR